MALKQTLMLGLAGAATIYLARKVPAARGVLDQAAPFNNGAIPLIPPGFMSKNNWSAAFWILPAAGAWYLSR